MLKNCLPIFVFPENRMKTMSGQQIEWCVCIDMRVWNEVVNCFYSVNFWSECLTTTSENYRCAIYSQSELNQFSALSLENGLCNLPRRNRYFQKRYWSHSLWAYFSLRVYPKSLIIVSIEYQNYLWKSNDIYWFLLVNNNFLYFSRPIRCPLCCRDTKISNVILLNTSCLTQNTSPVSNKQCKVVLNKYDEESIWSLVLKTRANLLPNMIRRHYIENRCNAGASTSGINQLSSNNSSASNAKGQKPSSSIRPTIISRRSRGQLAFQMTHCVQCSKTMVTEDCSKAFCSEKCLSHFNKRDWEHFDPLFILNHFINKNSLKKSKIEEKTISIYFSVKILLF